MDFPSDEEIFYRLVSLYEEKSFCNGKETKGYAYTISKKQLKRLAKKGRYTKNIIAGLADHCVEEGYLLIPLDNYFNIGNTTNFFFTKRPKNVTEVTGKMVTEIKNIKYPKKASK